MCHSCLCVTSKLCEIIITFDYFMPFQSRQPHILTCKFYACVIDGSVFIKTTITANQLKSNEVTVASINLADELVILLISGAGRQVEN